MISAELLNYAEIHAKLDFESLVGPPVRDMLKTAGDAIKSEAAANAPNDQGGLRGNFYNRVTKVDPTTWEAAVGNSKSFAAFQEYGTGTQHDNPAWGPRPRHYVPAKYLDGWAARHPRKWRTRGGKERDWTGADVARIIYARGGLRPLKFLRNAFAAEEMRLPSRAGTMAREIAARWEV